MTKQNNIRRTVWAMLLAAGFSGCIGDQITDKTDSNGKPVVFALSTTGNRAVSRALPGHPIENVPGQIDAGIIPDGKSFGVYAWAKPSTAAPVDNFAGLQNMAVTRGGGQYTYAPTASWPLQSDATLSFMAYYPHSATADAGGRIATARGGGANQWLQVTYTVSADAGRHVDLMYAKTAMTPGYDQVQLNFKHALTQLRFEARTEGFETGTNIKITGIGIKNAVMKGELYILDTELQPGKPLWNLHDDVAGDMDVPANHLSGSTLGSTLSNSIVDGGQMLVIPQPVAGLQIEATIEINGVPFPGPYLFDLEGTPDWAMNDIITYQMTVTPEKLFLEATVTPWNEANVGIIFDGQHHLSVSDDEFLFEPFDGTETLTIETNYNITSQGYPAGLYIETEYVSGAGGWLTLTNATGAEGSLSRTIGITATPNPSTTTGRTAKIKVTAGNLTKIVNVTQEPGLPNMSDVSTPVSLYNTYVGAFWRADQTGERLIRISNIAAAAAGDWAVQVYNYGDDFQTGDILFSTGQSAAGAVGDATTGAVNMNNPGNDAIYNVAEGKIYARGTVAAGGTIFFRVGLKTRWNTQTGYTADTKPARYAVIVLSYNNNTKYQKIWLRQGHEADYLMRPGDPNGSGGAVNGNRDLAAKFMPYNLTAPSFKGSGSTANSERLPLQFLQYQATDYWTDYPSQAGGFFQLGNTPRIRYAWNPGYPGAGAAMPDWDATSPTGFWDALETLNETCPYGYHRMNDASTSTTVAIDNFDSEYIHSLFLNPQLLIPNNQDAASNADNYVRGFYADGFFDRRTPATQSSNSGLADMSVSPGNSAVAHVGGLLYNKFNNASLFFPAAGIRYSGSTPPVISGQIYWAGSIGNYWSSGFNPYVNGTERTGWGFFVEMTTAYRGRFPMHAAFSIRCVKN